MMQSNMYTTYQSITVLRSPIDKHVHNGSNFKLDSGCYQIVIADDRWSLYQLITTIIYTNHNLARFFNRGISR